MTLRVVCSSVNTFSSWLLEKIIDSTSFFFLITCMYQSDADLTHLTFLASQWRSWHYPILQVVKIWLVEDEKEVQTHCEPVSGWLQMTFLWLSFEQEASLCLHSKSSHETSIFLTGKFGIKCCLDLEGFSSLTKHFKK